MTNQEVKTRNLATVLPASFILVVAVCLTLFSAASIYDSVRQYDQDKVRIESSFLNSQKEIIKREVDRAFDYIQIEQSRFERGVRQSMQPAADQFHQRVSMVVERLGSADIEGLSSEIAGEAAVVENEASDPLNLLVDAKGAIVWVGSSSSEPAFSVPGTSRERGSGFCCTAGQQGNSRLAP